MSSELGTHKPAKTRFTLNAAFKVSAVCTVSDVVAVHNLFDEREVARERILMVKRSKLTLRSTFGRRWRCRKGGRSSRSSGDATGTALDTGPLPYQPSRVSVSTQTGFRINLVRLPYQPKLISVSTQSGFRINPNWFPYLPSPVYVSTRSGSCINPHSSGAATGTALDTGLLPTLQGKALLAIFGRREYGLDCLRIWS